MGNGYVFIVDEGDRVVFMIFVVWVCFYVGIERFRVIVIVGCIVLGVVFISVRLNIISIVKVR